MMMATDESYYNSMLFNSTNRHVLMLKWEDHDDGAALWLKSTSV